MATDVLVEHNFKKWKKPGLWDRGVATGEPGQKSDRKKLPGLSDSGMASGGLNISRNWLRIRFDPKFFKRAFVPSFFQDRQHVHLMVFDGSTGLYPNLDNEKTFFHLLFKCKVWTGLTKTFFFRNICVNWQMSSLDSAPKLVSFHTCTYMLAHICIYWSISHNRLDFFHNLLYSLAVFHWKSDHQPVYSTYLTLEMSAQVAESICHRTYVGIRTCTEIVICSHKKNIFIN